MAPSPELNQPKAPDKLKSSCSSAASDCTVPQAIVPQKISAAIIEHHHTIPIIHATIPAAAVINCRGAGNTVRMAACSTTNATYTTATATLVAPSASHSAMAAATAAAALAAAAAVAKSAATSQNPTSSGSGGGPSATSAAIQSAAPSCSNVSPSSSSAAHSSINANEKTSKQLLKKAEREKEDNSFSFRSKTSRFHRGSSSNQHGGSLQDLFEAAQNDILLNDNDYAYGQRNRRNHHNSRPKKYSLVSSRQREGGSLPSNVNVSSCNLTVYDQPFLNEVAGKRRIGVARNERTCSGGSGTLSTASACGLESIASSCCGSNKQDDSMDNPHTVIEIGDYLPDERQHLLAHDSLAQGMLESLEDADEGTELTNIKKFPRASVNAIVRSKVEISNVDPKSYVDDTISFASLERVGKNVDTTCVTFDESYKSCKSILGEKSGEIAKATTATLFPTMKTMKQFDENGNSVNSYASSNSNQQNQLLQQQQLQQSKAKKKKSQSDRNTTTLNVQAVEGYRGEDTVENLLKFIENDETKKPEKSLNTTKKKDKRKEKQDKEINKKVKKSNSLEELRSCSKLDEDTINGNKTTENLCGGVTLRNKNKKGCISSNVTVNNVGSIDNEAAANLICKESKSSNSAGIVNSSAVTKNHKRTERRSWGEELTYLKENQQESLQEVYKDKQQKENKEKYCKRQKDINEPGKPMTLSIERPDKFERFKNKDSFSLNTSMNSAKSLSVQSIEAALSETAEFHVVTKRKKTKKRQMLDESSMASNRHHSKNSPATGKEFHTASSGGHRRYPTSSNFVSDRDAYLNSFNRNDPRRKSTSSVPPSEKSESSDVDSVHSLPIESSKSMHNSLSDSSSILHDGIISHKNAGLQPQSYADIAKIMNARQQGGQSSENSSGVTSPPSYDQWPTVSTNNSLQSASLAADDLNVSSFGNVAASSIKGYGPKSKALGRDFTDRSAASVGVVSLKSSGASSCSSTSSSSTVVRQFAYSNSFGDEQNSDSKSTTSTTPSNRSSVLATKTSTVVLSAAKVADVLKHCEANKLTLQKSKSMDNDSYYSIEQYPALENTVKKHIANLQGTSTITQTASAAAINQQTVSNPQQESDSTSNSSSISKLKCVFKNNLGISKSLLSSSDLANSLETTVPSNPTCVVVTNSTSNGPEKFSNTASEIAYSTIQNELDDTIVTSLDFTSDSDNVGNVSNLQNNSAWVDQPEKANSTTVLQEAATKNTASILAAKDVSAESHHQQTTIQNKSSKLDKSQPTTFTYSREQEKAKNYSKNINRPAVIILNDNLGKSEPISSDFTFGDFNEEELHLFDDNVADQSTHLEDFLKYNVTNSIDVISQSSVVSESNVANDDYAHLSPRSDQGYSSSTNNRSANMFSESIDTSGMAAPPDHQLRHPQPTPPKNAVIYPTEQVVILDQHQKIVLVDSRKFLTRSGATAHPTQLHPATMVVLQPQPSLHHHHHHPSQQNLIVQASTNLGTQQILAAAVSTPINTNKLLAHRSMNVHSHSITNMDNNLNLCSDTSANMINAANNSFSVIESSSLTPYVNQPSAPHSHNYHHYQLQQQIFEPKSSSDQNPFGRPAGNFRMSNRNQHKHQKVKNYNIAAVQVTAGQIKESNVPNLSSNRLDLERKSGVECLVHAIYSNESMKVSEKKKNTGATNKVVSMTKSSSVLETTDQISCNIQHQRSALRPARNEINLNFVDPPKSRHLNLSNFEKIVEYVGQAWNDVMLGLNEETLYYNGQ